jgi:flagellar basal body-associated protein FliL
LSFHRQAALEGRENRNDFARPVDETQDMKKRLFIILLVIAALLLAGLGTIISAGD